MKQLIHGGLVYDGSGQAPYEADVLLEDGLIAAVAPNLATGVADAKRLDATGRIVTPGFIDMHRHCDVAPFRDAEFGRLELAQGITATTVGNCGIACVPVTPQHFDEYSSFIDPVVGAVTPSLTYATFGEYVQALAAAKPAIHMGVLAGTGAIKVAVKGFADTPYTSAEMARAQAYVSEAMDAGALGVSLGFMYQPEYFTTPKEQAQLIAPAAKAGGLLTTHIRGEGDSLVTSVAEVITIAREAGIRLHISHFKATGIRNWRTSIYRAMELIERARDEGMPVTADFYPYAGGSTTVFSLIPPTVGRGSNDATLAYLATPEGKQALRKEIALPHAGWDNMALSIGWDRILIAGTQLAQHAHYAGQNVQQLAQAEGYTEPSDFVCDLLVAEKGRVGIVVLSMDEQDVDAVAKLPYTAVISDALYGGGGNPHPRLYGAFAHMLNDFVMRRKVLPLHTAIHKMTGMPAEILGLAGRGRIAAGYAGDINLFDPAQIADHAQYADSRKLSTGMERVLIGGVTVFEQEQLQNRHQGQVLQRK